MPERRKATTRSQPRKPAHPEENELCLSIPSTLSAIDPLCEQIRLLLEKRHLEQMQFPVEILARECLNNAILHGNHGIADSLVNFFLRVGKRMICMRVTDQGPGFDWRGMVGNGLPADHATCGRGLAVSGIYAQRIAFNRRGNQVTLWINTSKEG
jgi:serine/threonine-protein kinase RsbW